MFARALDSSNKSSNASTDNERYLWDEQYGYTDYFHLWKSGLSMRHVKANTQTQHLFISASIFFFSLHIIFCTLDLSSWDFFRIGISVRFPPGKACCNRVALPRLIIPPPPFFPPLTLTTKSLTFKDLLQNCSRDSLLLTAVQSPKCATL